MGVNHKYITASCHGNSRDETDADVEGNSDAADDSCSLGFPKHGLTFLRSESVQSPTHDVVLVVKVPEAFLYSNRECTARRAYHVTMTWHGDADRCGFKQFDWIINSQKQQTGTETVVN